MASTTLPNNIGENGNENQNPVFKNPWWIKACFHVIIINALLNILLIPGSIISLISALLFTWYGDKVQKDKLKVEGLFKNLVIVLCIMDIYSIYTSTSFIYKTGIYNILPFIKNIVEWFSALLGTFFLYIGKIVYFDDLSLYYIKKSLNKYHSGLFTTNKYK